MAVVSTGYVRQNIHPLDLVEETIALRDWALERTARDELLAEVTGRWCEYHIAFHWTDELGALQMTCAFDLRTPQERRAPVHELLAQRPAGDRPFRCRRGRWLAGLPPCAAVARLRVVGRADRRPARHRAARDGSVLSRLPVRCLGRPHAGRCDGDGRL